jgi:hypothetical protein
MAKKPETKFKDSIMPLLKALPQTWILKTQEQTIRGIPDCLLCIRGQFVALELKVPPNTLDALQEHVISKIKRAGGLALEVTPGNWPAVFVLLTDLALGKRVLVQEPNDDERPIKLDH